MKAAIFLSAALAALAIAGCAGMQATSPDAAPASAPGTASASQAADPCRFLHVKANCQ
jgi:hypothetical protein